MNRNHRVGACPYRKSGEYKMKTKKILLISLAMILVLMVTFGCMPSRTFRDAEGNSVTVSGGGDTMTIKGEDGDATVTTGSAAKWPSDKVGDLPELKGNVIAVIDTPDGLMIQLEGVKQSDFTAYVEKLKKAGYESAAEMEVEGTIMFMGVKGDKVVNAMFSADDSTGTAVITYGDN